MPRKEIKNFLNLNHSNILPILCADFEPFLTKSGLLRAVESFREQSLSCRIDSTQQISFCQKWLKIGTQYSKHILYNISESHNFFKKSAHVSLYCYYRWHSCENQAILHIRISKDSHNIQQGYFHPVDFGNCSPMSYQNDIVIPAFIPGNIITSYNACRKYSISWTIIVYIYIT